MPSMVSAVAMMDRLVQAAVGGAGMPRGPPGAAEPAILNAGGISAGTSSVAGAGSGWKTTNLLVGQGIRPTQATLRAAQINLIAQ